MAGIICKKVGMTRVFGEGGASVPCTVLESGPCVVTQIKDHDSDGYNAIQLAFDEKKEKNTTKPLVGHFTKASTTPKYKVVEVRDFDSSSLEKLELGMTILPSDVLEEGDYVDAIGTSKGKGFQGVMKRHGFSGVGDRTHGQHNRERAPGSIGGASYPSRVFKGMRMAGRMGGKRVTVQNLQVLKIMPEKNLIVVNGAVPGAKNGYIILQK